MPNTQENVEKHSKTIDDFVQNLTEEDAKSQLRSLLLNDYATTKSKRNVVILLHGMNTYGSWQEIAKDEIKKVDSSIKVYPIKYGRFDTLNFLYLNRHAPIKRILAQIRGIKADNEDANIVIIAHSFSTYIVQKILQKNSDIKILRLILCGSIIKQNFEWQNLARFPEGGVINDIGTRDIWPVVAKFVTLGYGSSGTFGFGSFKVNDRYHDFKHSDYFKEDFIKEFWIPFLLTGEQKDSDWGSKRSDVSWCFKVLDTPQIVWPIMLILIAWIFFFDEIKLNLFRLTSLF